jgi:RimJ/RimL family protein N-acetyltransferase
MARAWPVYLFYRSDGAGSRLRTLPPGYSCELWRPSPAGAIPAGLPDAERNRFRLRWLLHHLRIFSNRDYMVFVVRRGDEFAHYSGVTGRYWRFPFLAKNDLQIGDTWTHPDHRGKGLAGFAARSILAAMSRPGRRIWYVVEDINTPSIRTAEGAGMSLYARGVWRRPFNLKLLGSYEIREVVAANVAPGEGRAAAELSQLNSREAPSAPMVERVSSPASPSIRRA